MTHTSAFAQDLKEGQTIRARGQQTNELRHKDIWNAAARGSIEETEDLYHRYPRPNINAIDPKLGSVLTAAAQSGVSELVSKVLSWKAEPSIQGGRYFSTLQAAAHSGNLETVQMLLHEGARQTSIGGFYSTPLVAAAEKGSFDMVHSILDVEPIDINVSGGNHGSALMAAAHRGQT
ncbi:hypothetical protein MMC13_004346 [Lambiella insularis]|nr:hypothetical protein [Lambiella insularis]